MANKGAEVLAIISLSCYCVAYATDPNQLQDFCVATNDLNSAAFVNGLICKNPMAATPEDFLFKGLNIPRNTDNKDGSNVTIVSAANLPGLNTLGISMGRTDFGPYGLGPPHTHPRATEITTVIKGKLLVGFVTSNKANNAKNQLFTKVLNEGDVFVFPQGLIHFVQNIDQAPAVTITALSSQNPGVITVPNAVFGSDPSIPVDVLSKAFRTNNNVVNQLRAQFQM